MRAILKLCQKCGALVLQYTVLLQRKKALKDRSVTYLFLSIKMQKRMNKSNPNQMIMSWGPGSDDMAQQSPDLNIIQSV